MGDGIFAARPRPTMPPTPPTSSHPILRLLSTEPKRVIGLTAGTSLDGIDAALCEVSGHGLGASVRLLAFRALPFPPGLREAIEALLDPRAPASAADVSTVNFRLGQAFADAALAVAGDAPIDLCGCHGQSLWHQPPWMKERADLIASTLQVGEPAVVAAQTGAVTVGDFRVADVALLGEGAPLTPWPDYVLFRRPGAVRALQNIGGFASVTVVSDRLVELVAFDNGPGNLLIDALAAHALAGRPAESIDPFRPLGKIMDRDGALSAEGRVLDDVLEELLDDDYLRRPPPKSAGRERYGRAFVEALLARRSRERPLDLLATAVAFVAESIARSYRSFVFPRLREAGLALDEVLVSGGGAHNRTLMAELGERLAPVPVREFDERGVPADAKEAVDIALLAVECIHAAPANVPAATGARRPAVLGKICLPPP